MHLFSLFPATLTTGIYSRSCSYTLFTPRELVKELIQGVDPWTGSEEQTPETVSDRPIGQPVLGTEVRQLSQPVARGLLGLHKAVAVHKEWRQVLQPGFEVTSNPVLEDPPVCIGPVGVERVQLLSGTRPTVYWKGVLPPGRFSLTKRVPSLPLACFPVTLTPAVRPDSSRHLLYLLRLRPGLSGTLHRILFLYLVPCPFFLVSRSWEFSQTWTDLIPPSGRGIAAGRTETPRTPGGIPSPQGWLDVEPLGMQGSLVRYPMDQAQRLDPGYLRGWYAPLLEGG